VLYVLYAIGRLGACRSKIQSVWRGLVPLVLLLPVAAGNGMDVDVDVDGGNGVNVGRTADGAEDFPFGTGSLPRGLLEKGPE